MCVYGVVVKIQRVFVFALLSIDIYSRNVQNMLPNYNYNKIDDKYKNEIYAVLIPI